MAELFPRQNFAFLSPATEILYGGAAGGGKSYLERTSAIRWCCEIPGIQVYLFRRTLPDLRDNHLRGPTCFQVMLSDYIQSGHVKGPTQENELKFWNGSVLHLCYCDSENDVTKYQGAEIHCLEENESLRMADGSLKYIKEIREGDYVNTLQGARKVTWIGDRELKPCVMAKVSSHGMVTQQVHSRNHKVLTQMGWVSYDDIANESRLSSIYEPIETHSSRKCVEPFASESRSLPPSHENPYQGSGRKAEFSQLLQGRQSDLAISACVVQQVQENDSEASLYGNLEVDTLSSSFSFPVVLHAPSQNQGEVVSLRVSQRDAESCVQSECMHEDCQCDCQTSHDLHDEYQSVHLDKNRDVAHKQGDVLERTPKKGLPLDGQDIIHKCIPLGQLQYAHPYTGEERTAEENVCLGTCVVTPCGEKWTIDLMVEGENHYITESGFVNKNCLIMDELTHFTEYQYRFLRSRVRVAGLKIPDKYKGMLPRIECASNPGSIGHAWVKRSFISPKSEGVIWRTPPEEGGMLRQFIPAKLSDNPALTKDDPNYADRLRGMGSDALTQAMLDGNWDIIAGQAFEKLDKRIHRIEPFDPPEDWLCIGGFDWGSSRPFSFVAATVSNGDALPDGRVYPRGALIIYDEWYGWNGKPNEGLRMEVAEVCDGIKERLKGRKLAYIAADPAMWKVDGGPSHAEVFARRRLPLRKADNSRIAGYLEVRGRIAGGSEGAMLYVSKYCHDGFWRCMPDLVMDERHTEDLDTDQEEHVYDSTRYLCMSRVWVKAIEKKKPKLDMWDRAFARESTGLNWKTV